jgi:hypothetical protein
LIVEVAPECGRRSLQPFSNSLAIKKVHLVTDDVPECCLEHRGKPAESGRTYQNGAPLYGNLASAYQKNTPVHILAA